MGRALGEEIDRLYQDLLKVLEGGNESLEKLFPSDKGSKAFVAGPFSWQVCAW